MCSYNNIMMSIYNVVEDDKISVPDGMTTEEIESELLKEYPLLPVTIQSSEGENNLVMLIFMYWLHKSSNYTSLVITIATQTSI